MRPTGVAAALLVAAAATAAGCRAGNDTTVPSSSVPPDDIPPCSEVYADGVTVSDADFGVACVTEDERLVAPRPIRIECDDDRILLWNDFAWGFLGEPMTLTPVDAPSKMPAEALNDCLAATDGDGVTPSTAGG